MSGRTVEGEGEHRGVSAASQRQVLTNRLTDPRMVAVVVVAAAVRLYGLTAESLWTDELITVDFITRMSPLELLVLLPFSQPHLPLYYVLLDLWLGVAGISELTLRLPAAVFGVATVALCYVLGTELYDRNAGFVGAALVALSRDHIDHSQEVRMYSLLTLLAVASTLWFVRARRYRTWQAATVYVASTLLLVATHPFAVFVPLAQAAFLVADWVGRGRPAVTDGLSLDRAGMRRAPFRAAVGATWVVAGPVLLVLLWKIQGVRFHYVPPATPRHLANTIAVIVGFEGLDTIFIAVGLFVVSGLVTVAVVVAVRRWRTGRPLGPTALLVACTAGPFLALLAISLALTPMFWPRYVLAMLPPLALLVGRGATALGDLSHPGVSLGVVVVVLALLTVPVVELHTTTEREQWRSAGAVVDRQAEPGDVVLVADAITVSAVEYYVDRDDVAVRGVVVKNSGTGASPDSTAEIDALAGDGDRVWVTVSHTSEAERERVLHVVGEDRTLVRKWSFVKVDLYLFERTPDANRSAVDDGRVTANRAPSTAGRSVGHL